MDHSKPPQIPTHKDWQIEVLNLRPVRSGHLKAFVDVRLNGALTIHDFRVVQQPGQSPWVSVPVREWQPSSGERRFVPLVECAPDLKRKITRAVLSAWETCAASGHENTGGRRAE